MISIKDFIRKHFNLSNMTLVRIANGAVIVHGIKVATIEKVNASITLTLTGSNEVINLSSYSKLSY